MREIKFRAWAEKTVNNVWEYAYPLAQAESKESIEEVDERELRYKYSKQWHEKNPKAEEYTKTKEMIIDIKVNGTCQRPYGYEVIDVMQYTGLKDKNGKEIYEGDIIRYCFRTKESNETFVSEVRFDEYMWLTDEHSINRINSIEVIGNLYENPELLTN